MSSLEKVDLIKKGITVYKINSKTYERVEVGYISLNGRLMFRTLKSEVMSSNPSTYQRNFEVIVTDSKTEIHTSIRSDDREVFVKDETNTWSIGYFDKGKLVLWSQYE